MPPPSTLPPPGWYSDPAGRTGLLRWWDGTRWAPHLRAGPPPAPATTAPGWATSVGWAAPGQAPGAPPPAGTAPAGAPPPAGTAPAGAPPPAGPQPPPPTTRPPHAPPPGAVAAPPRTAGPLLPGSPPAPPARRIPARAAWWAVVGFAAGQVIGGLLSVIAAAATGTPTDKLTTSTAVVLAGEVGLWVGLLGACLAVSHHYGTGSLRRDLALSIRPVDVGYGVVVALAALAVDGIVTQAFAHTRYQGTNTQLLTGQRHHSAGFAVVTVVVAVGAPFFEELFFRGLLRTALRARARPALAVVAQAALFGLAHIQSGAGWGNVSVVVGITAIGLILGVVAERTGRLGAGMVGHGLFNLSVAIMAVTT